MYRFLKALVIYVSLILVSFGDLMAGGVCFRGKPLPECRAFLITEAGAMYRFGKAKTHDKWYATLMYNWELGLMFNQNRRQAFGGSLFLDFDDYSNITQAGMRPRYRRWLFSRTSLDIAPGLILAGSEVENLAFSGEAMINVRDYIALTLRLDLRNRRALWYGGIRFCSYPGLAVGLAGPIIALIIWGNEHNSNGNMRL